MKIGTVRVKNILELVTRCTVYLLYLQSVSIGIIFSNRTEKIILTTLNNTQGMPLHKNRDLNEKSISTITKSAVRRMRLCRLACKWGHNTRANSTIVEWPVIYQRFLLFREKPRFALDENKVPPSSHQKNSRNEKRSNLNPCCLLYCAVFAFALCLRLRLKSPPFTLPLQAVSTGHSELVPFCCGTSVL